MANIYFKHMELTNFMSYSHAEIDLNRQGNILVGGKNLNPDDAAKSNGSGKSSLFSALLWCLTGETASGSSDVSNIYIKGKTEVTVDFKIDNKFYKITRTKNPSNLFIYIDGINKSGKGIRDTSKLLLEYIPQLTPSLLNSVIILGQGLPQRFTNNTPAGRKDVLEKLSNSEFMIEDLKDRLTTRKKVLEEDKRKLEDSNLTSNTLINANNNQIKKHEQELAFIEDKETLKKALSEIELELEHVEELKADSENKLQDLDTEIKSKEELKYNIAQKVYEEINSYEHLPYDVEEKELIQIKSNISSLQRKIRELDSVTDVCPTCGQKLPNVTKIDTTDLKKELSEYQLKESELARKILEIKEQDYKNIDAINSKYEGQTDKLNAEVSVLYDQKTKESRLLNTYKNDLSSFNSRHTTISTRLSQIDKEIEYCNTRIKELKEENKNLTEKVYNNNEELSVIAERIAINTKMMTLIKRDFRGYLLNNVISFIENRAKEYSLEVFGTDKLAFMLEGNNINISYDSKDYSCLSGGEKQKLDIIIQFAIRDMLCTFLGFSSNILVLDEITDALDVIGVGKIFDLISSQLQDVEATYIISHHVDELEIPADDEIIIIKGDDKISRIV